MYLSGYKYVVTTSNVCFVFLLMTFICRIVTNPVIYVRVSVCPCDGRINKSIGGRLACSECKVEKRARALPGFGCCARNINSLCLGLTLAARCPAALLPTSFRTKKDDSSLWLCYSCGCPGVGSSGRRNAV